MPTTRRRAISSPLPTEAMSQPQSLQSRPGRASMTLQWVSLEPINNRPLSRPRNARPIAPRLGRRSARHGKGRLQRLACRGVSRARRGAARPHRANGGRLRTARGRYVAVTQCLRGTACPVIPSPSRRSSKRAEVTATRPLLMDVLRSKSLGTRVRRRFCATAYRSRMPQECRRTRLKRCTRRASGRAIPTHSPAATPSG